MSEQEERVSGPDTLVAFVRGDSIPALKLAALDRARELYGPSAQLRIEQVDEIHTSGSDEGKFATYVRVRCLDLPEEDR